MTKLLMHNDRKIFQRNLRNIPDLQHELSKDIISTNVEVML